MNVYESHSPICDGHIAHIHKLADEALEAQRREHEIRMQALQEGHERRMREQYLPFDEAYFCAGA